MAWLILETCFLFPPFVCFLCGDFREAGVGSLGLFFLFLSYAFPCVYFF